LHFLVLVCCRPTGSSTEKAKKKKKKLEDEESPVVNIYRKSLLSPEDDGGFNRPSTHAGASRYKIGLDKIESKHM
jgi:hypothetical protein